MNELLDLLACPRCDKALDEIDAGHRCAGCKIDFPALAEIPWLFSEPNYARSEWRQRLDFLSRRLEHDTQQIDQALTKRADLLPLTCQRLESRKAALTDQSERFRALLEPLELDASSTSYEMYLALRTQLPPDQGLTTYYPNLHRDWCWGDEENEAALGLLASGLKNLTGETKVLVLGSGAGRLAYDIHNVHSPAITVALDFNPLLQLVLQRVANGETVELFEFPLAPRSLEDHAVLREHRAPAATRPGLHAVLGDALRAPFKNGAFDVVVTPWLVDILPDDFATLCQRINCLLADKGRWLNFGSLQFGHAGFDRQYSPEECAALVEAAGFATPETEEATVPYLSSPASRHGRQETVFAWQAVKTRKSKQPARYAALPDWLVKGTDPVPVLEAFRVQAASTRIHAGLMSLIDGKRSLKDMAKILVNQRVMTLADAEPAIRTFLTKMYQDSQRGQRL
jgi:SAM-dependent methyltransferase/uncharacterized protein YbaR (Trm112 family)